MLCINVLGLSEYLCFIREGLIIVRSLSGKNWQDRDKADKVSISIPATPKDT